MSHNIITIWVAVFVFEVLMGMLAQSVAERKGHPRRWFWAGFLLSLVGVVWAAGLPDENLRRELRRLQERWNPVEGPDIAGSAVPDRPAGEDEYELAAVLSAAVAAMGEEEGRRFVMRSFRPAGAGSTAWNRAARHARATHR